MRQEDQRPAGEKRQVRRVNPTHDGSSSHLVSAFNVSGIPCEVLYQSHQVSPDVHPAGLHLRPDGTVWTSAGPGGALQRQIDDTSGRELVARAAQPDQAVLSAQHQPGGPIEPPAAAGDLYKIHQLLRGRYVYAAVLALLLGSVGIWAGLRLGQKTYQSQGLLNIVRVELFPKSDGAQSTEQFMEAQAAKLKGQRVMDAAMDDPLWRNLGRARSDEVEAAFVKELEVMPQGSMLVVKFTDRDPQAAAAAVQSAMNAFKRIFDAEQTQNGLFAQDQMTAARNELRANLTRIQQEMDEIAGNYGPDALEVQRTIKLQELHDYEKAIRDVEQAQAEALTSSGAPTTQPSEALSVEQIARLDPSMQSLLAKRASTQDEIASMQANHYMDEHPKVRAARIMLSVVQGEIEQRAKEWKSMRDSGLVNPAVSVASLTPEQLKRRLSYFQASKAATDDQLKQLSDKIQQIDKLKIQKDPIQSDLAVAEQWLQKDELQKTAWRVEITDADRPLAAYRDTRITFAGAGGFGGLVMGAGLVLMVGFMDRRVRHPDEAPSRFYAGPVLGMLPQLPEDLSDSEQAAIVAHSVHGVRTLLQIWGQGRNHQVFAVTSSAAGSGKTSLTLALGISYASAKFRTLLIDCDLVGRGLSKCADAIVRKRIGAILVRDGYITDVQLQEAIKRSSRTGRKLGETLVELGHLSAEELLLAIEAQEQHAMGLLDTLAGEDLKECIAPMGIEGLWVLPLGDATALHAGTLSPEELRRLVYAARECFDVVLIDTGPVPGSLEASLVASQVDAVVLAVARGDRKPEVERSVTHLRSVGANLAGVVFNRARVRDIERYGSSSGSSVGSFSGADMRLDERKDCSRLGPLAQAVASFAPSREPSRSRSN